MGKTTHGARREVVTNKTTEKTQLKGDRYFRDGNWGDALSAYENELRTCQIVENSTKELVLTRQISETLSNLAEFDKAIEYAKKYLRLARDLGNKVEEQRAYTTLGRMYFAKVSSLDASEHSTERREPIEQACSAYKKSFKLISELKDVLPPREIMEMTAIAHLNTGLIYEADRKLIKAVDHLNNATDICRMNKFDYLYNCYVALGNLYLNKKDYNEAMTNFTLSINSADSLRDSEGMCQSYLDRAKIFFILKEFTKAKNELTTASRLQVASFTKDIHLAMKRARVLCRAETELVNLPELKFNERKKLYERIGDTLCNMELYSPAIPFYENMVKCSEAAGDSREDLAAAYVSLAQTFCDNKQYDEAIGYYKKELELWTDNPKESSRTCVNLGAAMEKSQKKYEYLDIEEQYMNGRSFAVQAGSVKLEAGALDYLIALQKKFDFNLLAVESQKERDLMNVSSDEEEEPEETPDVEWDDDDEEEEEFDRTMNRSRPQRSRAPRLNMKKNDVGESPLHRACIEGSLAKVQTLVKQGHPVNVRDHTGWLPLHEACNHDCIEIVEFLLDNGATINDPGLSECGGVTPLIDAASCGNLNVMEVLLDRGANILNKTTEGHTALDSMLLWYTRANKPALTAQFMLYFREIEGRLRKAMMQLGYSVEDLPAKSTSPDRLLTSIASKNTARANQNLPVKRRSAIEPRNKFSSIGRLRRAVHQSDSDEDVPRYRKVSSDEDSTRSDEDNGGRAKTVVRGDAGRCMSSQSSSWSTQERSTHGSVVDRRVPPLMTNSDRQLAPVEDYCSVMKNVRHPVTLADKQLDKDVDATDDVLAQPFLLDDEVGNDWLVDDLADIQPTKRRRTDRTGIEFLGDVNRTSASRPPADWPIRSSRLHADEPGRRSPSPTPSSSRDEYVIPSTYYSPPRVEASDDSFVDLTTEEMGEIQRRCQPQQASLLDAGFSRHRPTTSLNRSRSSYPPLAFTASPHRSVVASEPAAPLAAPLPVQPAVVPLSITVLIEDKLFLVPIVLQQTIGDLAQEAAKRYYRLVGVQPTLSLTTKEGALLADDDPVSLIVGSDRVLTIVTSWNMPTLVERYNTELCRNSAQAKVLQCGSIERSLVACEATRALTLVDLALTSVQLAPVLTALHARDKVEKINLGGNLLKDDGVKLLAECLKRMSDLTELNLSCNYITSRGLEHLSRALETAESKPLQKLSLLDLSHNFLGDEAGVRNLANILDNVSVKTLSLQSCDLNSGSFQCSSSALPPLLCLDSVEKLDISYNRLGRDGIASFLGRLSTRHLASLDLASTGCSDSTVTRELILFLERDCPESLKHLNLSDNNVTDQDFVDLLQSLERADKLRTLIATSNPMGFRSLEMLAEKCPSLVHFDCSGCSGLQSAEDGDDPFISMGLKSLTLSVGKDHKAVLTRIESIWAQNWGSRSIINRGPGGSLYLSVATK